MKHPRLDELLNKYYEGHTSSAEENELRILFHSRSHKPFHCEKTFFIVLEENRSMSLPEDFEERLEDKIQELQKARHNRISGSFLIKIAASLIVLAVFAYWAIRTLEAEEEIITTTTNPTYIELPDGSRVWLNKESALRYAVNFTENRKVRLQGEGFFEVAHNPSLPFTISAANTTTEVLGTSFNVRSYAEENIVEVIVVSGTVAFSTSDAPKSKTVLNKDEKIAFSSLTGSASTSRISNQNPIAWKTKKLRFDDEQLNNVITDLERYAGIKIDVENKSILNCHYTGTFNNANTKEILAALSYSLGIACHKKDGLYILTGEGCP